MSLPDRSAQYYWNSTNVEYLCDDRIDNSLHWNDFELVTLGYSSKMASGPYCNATATYRGEFDRGDFITINGAIADTGSTWGCSLDGKQWVWYHSDGNGESWQAKVLCGWTGLDVDTDLQTWLASDPSGKTAVAVTSWIGLGADSR
ncbi:hypothetical protein JCM10212_003686 [Sporobolomyces blumeae]